MELRWARESRPCAGETLNGDRALVLERGGAIAYVVLDALGHGPRAHEAAELATAALEEAMDLELVSLFDRAHRALRGSRGIGMTVVVQRGDRLAGAGVGNVALRVLGDATLPLLPTPGVLGAQMRALRITDGLRRGPARIILHSDGISHRFASDDVARRDLAAACAFLVAEHGISHDDATVLVADL